MREIAFLTSTLLTFVLGSNAWSQSPNCPVPPSITPLTITHSNNYQVAYLDVTNSPSFYNNGNFVPRYTTAYKEHYGQETKDILPNNIEGHVISYNLRASGGNYLSGLDNYNMFDFVNNAKLPVWKNKTGYLPYGTVLQNIPQNKPGSVQFAIEIPGSQSLPPAGTSQIEFVLYSYYADGAFSACSNLYPSTNTNGLYRLIALSNQRFSYYVPTSTAISMVGGGTSGDIKFNTGNGLKTGEKKSITINVKSNQKYKVSFDSAYNGYLNLNNAPGATEKVPYTMTFSGQTVSDSAAFTDDIGTGGSDAPKTLEVTIGNTDNARAGWYKDVVTLTITSPY